jgi:hypothetical protein
MPEIGKGIHEKYHWVSCDVPLLLFLGNTRGPGTCESAITYLTMFKDEFNVVRIHQRPCLPVTNMLDLRVWMALKNVVENYTFASKWS